MRALAVSGGVTAVVLLASPSVPVTLGAAAVALWLWVAGVRRLCRDSAGRIGGGR